MFDSVTPWTVAHQAPLSMGFSRQEYWSGLLSPSPGDLPNSRIKPTSLMLPALAGGFSTTEPPGKPWKERWYYICACPLPPEVHALLKFLTNVILTSGKNKMTLGLQALRKVLCCASVKLCLIK